MSDDVLRRRRQLAAGQMLADEQPNGDTEGRLGLGRDRIERGFFALRFERRIQILRDAVHAQRTDRRDARVFDPAEHFFRRTFTRRAALIDRFVVVTQPQRELVADAANHVDFGLGGTDRRQRHANPIARRRRRAVAERDVEFVVFRERAHRRDGRALERLQRIVLVVHGLLPCRTATAAMTLSA